jgi:hypothetical protein
MIWLVPLLALAVAWREWWLGGALMLAFVLTLVEFPGLYPGLVHLEQLPTTVVGLRNVALLAALAFALAVMRRRSAAPPAPV